MVRPPLLKPENIICMAVNYMEDGTLPEPAEVLQWQASSLLIEMRIASLRFASKRFASPRFASLRFARDATAALVLGLLVAALLAQNADAQTKPDRWSANYLMPACRNWIAFAGDRQGIDEAMCAGIISGLAYTAKFLRPDTSSCRPQGVTTGQMVRVVVAYIERRPERMYEDFRRLAIEAWHEAWPCM